MPVNLLNEKDLNDYLTDIVYHGQEMEAFSAGNFKSAAYVEQHKDAIVRSMLLQWCKHRLRSHLAEDLPEHKAFLQPVETAEPDLPTWAERCLAEGKPVYRFEAAEIPEKMTANINMICDFLYAKAENYINKTLDAKAQDKEGTSPKLRIDCLKTQSAFDTFEKTLEQAQKWHETMAQNAAERKRNEEMYQASLPGTHRVRQFADGMEMVKLTTPEALDYESECMGHCVGGGSYDEGIKQDTTRIYSLRDKDGLSHATLEIRVNRETGVESLYQCKGKGNKAPVAKYLPHIQEFIRVQEYELVSDRKNTGLIKQDGEYYDVLHLPKNFVVKGDLDLSDKELSELPDLSDVEVQGSFYCSHNNLTSLKGAPKKVGGTFGCGFNQLTSLEGAPKKVGGSFGCGHNELISLKGAPEEVGTDFICCSNQLTSLEYAPREVKGDFECAGNYLPNLEHAPQKVGGDFNCCQCHDTLTSLKGAPREVGKSFFCQGNLITSLEGGPELVGRNYDCSNNNLRDNCLKGAPRKVGGHFCCLRNELPSLEGGPEIVGGNFDCSANNLVSLKGAPQKVGSNFWCNRNELRTLEGAAPEVNGSFDCRYNHLVSLKGGPQKIKGNFECEGNPLASLKYLPVCRIVHSDIDAEYDPSVIGSECGIYIPYDMLVKIPRFKKELREVLAEKREAVRYKIKRNEAAKNVSPEKGEIRPKRTGKNKLKAKADVLLAQIKQRVREYSKH